LENLRSKILALAELVKIKITFFVAFSTTAGYILYSKELSFGIITASLGVFLLACGSSAINHFQERKTDGLMNRTKNRPLPAGKISERQALIIICLLLVSGTIVLYVFTNLVAVLLGLTAVVWYNAIYTPLKKKTALAVVPGALIGAIPPMVGYVSAGGYIFNFENISLALFFFIWQVPHFWLLLLLYEKDYERAGFPVLSKSFSIEQLSRITFTWIFALAASCLAIPFFGSGKNLIIELLLVFSACWLIIKSSRLLVKNNEKLNFRFAFKEINTFVLIVVLLISINKLVFS